MQEQRNKVLTERIAGRWVRLHTALVLFFLIAPILAIIPLSFNSGSYFSYPLQGFSLRWYGEFFRNGNFTDAFQFSLKLAGLANVKRPKDHGRQTESARTRAAHPRRQARSLRHLGKPGLAQSR